MSGGRRKEEPPQPQLANGALKVSVWSKVLRSDAAWDDKVRKAPARVRVRAQENESGCLSSRPGAAVGAGSGWRGCRRAADECGPERGEPRRPPPFALRDPE
ncbi:hypothetical protein ACRRTK_013368 [Alexandromys fortis]